MDASILSVFLLGLLGGIHCASMCGGIVAVLGSSARRIVPIVPAGTSATRTRWPLLIAYNAGRITSYSVAGAIAAGMGSVAMLAGRLLPIQQVAFVAANLVLIAMGLYLVGAWRSIAGVEAIGRRGWSMLQPLASRTLHAHTPLQGFAAGLVWGWVPCGMVYGVLVAAVVSADPPRGAMLMASFGLGTLPNLLALGWSAARLRGFLQRPAARWSAGGLVIAFGVAGLARIDPFAHLHAVVDACLTLVAR